MPHAWMALVLILAALWQAAEVERAKTALELGKGRVSIEYGPPRLRGRNLDDMIQPGIPWRLGANMPTSLETTVPLKIGGKSLAPGKYVLFARPDPDKKWTLLVTTGDPDSAVAQAPLRFSREDQSIEALEIKLDKAARGANLRIAWGNYRLLGTIEPGT